MTNTRTPAASSPGFVIPSLDGIRAVSILIVFAAHIGYEDVVPGGFGVTIFFFLSGYLITTLLRREVGRTGDVDVVAFYKRRAWRILPPMYLCLAVATIFGLLGVTATDPSARAVLFQALHLTNFMLVLDPGAGVPDGTFAYWSLAIEEHFYLVYPFVAMFLLRRFEPATQAKVLLGLCGMVLLWRYVLVVGFDANAANNFRTYLATDTRIDAIAFGCVLGLWHNPALDPPRLLRPVARFAVLGVALGVILLSLALRGEVFRETLRYTMQSAALAPIFYLAIAHHRNWPFSWLAWRPLKFLGLLSYVFYLMHQVFIFAFEHHTSWGRWPVAGASFVVTIAFAWVVHEVMEKPIAKIRHRLSRA